MSAIRREYIMKKDQYVKEITIVTKKEIEKRSQEE